MKKSTKFIALLMALITLLSCQTAALAAVSTSKYTGYKYTHQSRFDNRKILNGIDVSEHNGSIDFKKVKAAGVDFVFVRVGYTGYTRSKFSLNYDAYYKTNIKNALANGLAVGVYWYSQATTKEEATAEADRLTSAIKDYSITLPVVMDYEFADVSSGRLDYAWRNKTLTKDRMTDIALAFLDRINESGYEACIYANRYFLTDNVDGSLIDDSYKVWLADYSTKTPYKNNFEFWQYSAAGSVSGISGRVDMNFWYYQPEIKESGNILEQEFLYTGNAITPSVTLVIDDKLLVQDVDYTLSYSNNVKVGYGTVTASGTGDYQGKKWQFKFKIVPRQPVCFSLTGRTATSLNFSWNKVDGAQRYYLSVKNNTKGTTFSKTVTTNSATLNGLTPANEYSVTVKAGGSSGSSTVWGAESKINTKHALPDKVTGLKLAAAGTDYIKLSWNKKAGCDGYRIYKYIASSKKYVVVADVSGAASTSYTVKNLTPGTAYSYRVSAFTEDTSKKVGAKSDMLNTAAKPLKLSLTSASSPSGAKITVKFKKAKATGYQIQWSSYKDFSSNRKTISFTSSASTVQKTVTAAQRKKTYYVRVRAYKKAGGKTYYGAWSTAKTVKTK